MSPEQQQLQIQNEERQLEILQQRQNLRQQLIGPGTSGQRRSWPISIEAPDPNEKKRRNSEPVCVQEKIPILKEKPGKARAQLELPDMERQEKMEGMGIQEKKEGMGRQEKIKDIERQGKIIIDATSAQRVSRAGRIQERSKMLLDFTQGQNLDTPNPRYWNPHSLHLNN